MPKSLPIIAAIPSYNAAKTLPPLIDELIKQKYDGIIVLDDASTDSTTKVVRPYKTKVRLIEGKRNVGTGANRNRIIGQTTGAILHFIDADMRLLSKDTPKIIRSLVWHDDTAYFGGLIRNPTGEQNPFNFGPRGSLIKFFHSAIQYGIWRLGLRSRALGAFFRRIAQPLLRPWPNIYIEPAKRQTIWTAESNMIIKSDFFAKMGGYDPRFRYSEISDFSVRLIRDGYKVYFDPRIDAIHTTMDNILLSRSKRLTAWKLFVRKYGLLIFIAPSLSDWLEKLRSKA